jgi:hypothetical protein
MFKNEKWKPLHTVGVKNAADGLEAAGDISS